MASFEGLINIVKALTDNKAGAKVNSTIKSIGKATDTSNNSLRKMNRNLVLQFPILCSESITLDVAKMLANAFETEYCELILNVISNQAINVVDSADEINTQELLKKYHQNINRTYFSEEQYLEVCNKYSSKPIDEMFNMTALNDFTLPKYFEEGSNILNKDQMKEYDDLKNQKQKMDEKENDYNYLKKQRAEANKASLVKGNAISDEKVLKKVNGISPLRVTAKVKYLIKDTSTTPIENTISFGLKAVTHKLKHEDIVYYLGNYSRSNNLFVNLIRWTTGEIKLFKDIILCTSMNKKLAKQSYDNDSYWWSKLMNITSENKVKNVATSKKAISIATMVITKDDVDAIKRQFGFDLLSQTKITRKLIDQFSLLTFAVVDESTEVLHLFDENTHTFTLYPFRSLKTSDSKKVDIDDISNFVSIFGKKR